MAANRCGTFRLRLTRQIGQPLGACLFDQEIQPFDSLGRDRLQHLHRLDQALGARLGDQTVGRRVEYSDLSETLAQQAMNLRWQGESWQKLTRLAVTVNAAQSSHSVTWTAFFPAPI